MGLIDDLRAELARGEVLVVVGTGVSIQATDGAECATWSGLIRNGIEHAAGTNLLTVDDSRKLCNRLQKNTIKDFLDVAQKVSEALGAPDGVPPPRIGDGDTAGHYEVEANAMTIDVDAVYENGVLKLKQPVDLPENAEVHVTIQTGTEARTPLGRRLRELRAKIVKSGAALLGWEEIDSEVAVRRGGFSELGLPTARVAGHRK